MPDKKTEMFEILPEQVKLKEGLPRLRKQFKNIEGLAESIKDHGQIQPIVLNRKMELVCGGRRLVACALAGLPVQCIYADALDELAIRELELEENLQREDLTPSEEAKGIEELHKLKQTKYGKATSGTKGGWTLDDTAKLVGKTRGSIIDDLKIAGAVREYPELEKAKTKSEIKKAFKGIQKVVERAGALEEFLQSPKTASYTPEIIQADARDHMRTQPDNSVDLLLTDPPYGINIDKLMTSIGGQTGGLSTAGFKFSDDEKTTVELYEILSKESFRFCKPNAHAYIFVAPDFFWFLKALFRLAGWEVNPKPIIWVKNISGQCNMPAYWPASCYEMILFARKSESRLVTEGRADWIQCPPVHESTKKHDAEKPVPLLKELINRTTLPGRLLYDPFMGSGAMLEAALEMNLYSIGVDSLIECCNAASQRTVLWIEESKKSQ